MQQHKVALAKVHAGYLCMGLTAALVKAVSWDPLSLVFARMLIAGVLIASIIAIRSHDWKIKRSDLGAMLLSTILFTVHWLTFFYSIKVSDVPTAVIAVSTIPVFSALLEPLFHKHKPSGIDFILAIGVVIGALIIIEDFSLQNGASLGLLLGIFSALTKSLRDIMSRILVGSYGSLRVMSYQMLIGMLLLLPFFRPSTLDWSSFSIGNILAIGIIGTALAHTLTTTGFSHLKAITVNLIGMLAPLYQILFGILIVQNFPTTRVVVGGIIIIGISGFETWRQNKLT